MHVNERLGIRLRRATFAVRRLLMSRIAPLGVTHEQYLILLYLAEQDGITQNELARRSFTNPNTITDILRRLESDGAVCRFPDDTDRRAMRVEITAQGRALRDRLVAIADGIIELVLRDLGPSEPCEREIFLRGLDLVAEAAEKALGRGGA